MRLNARKKLVNATYRSYRQSYTYLQARGNDEKAVVFRIYNNSRPDLHTPFWRMYKAMSGML